MGKDQLGQSSTWELVIVSPQLQVTRIIRITGEDYGCVQVVWTALKKRFPGHNIYNIPADELKDNESWKELWGWDEAKVEEVEIKEIYL